MDQGHNFSFCFVSWCRSWTIIVQFVCTKVSMDVVDFPRGAGTSTSATGSKSNSGSDKSDNKRGRKRTANEVIGSSKDSLKTKTALPKNLFSKYV